MLRLLSSPSFGRGGCQVRSESLGGNLNTLMYDDWHDAVLNALKTLPWAATVDAYPETFTPLKTPCIFLDVPGWRPEESPDGQAMINLQADLFVVVDRSSRSPELPAPAVYLRCLAMDLSQWLDGEDFGLEAAEGAVFTEAESDEFDKRLDEYLVYRVSFEQIVPAGLPVFPLPSGVPLQKVWLGISPDIGKTHEDDYRLVFDSENGGLRE